MKKFFEYTTDGCSAAKIYLEKIGKLKELERERSVDGYTLVYLANHYLDADKSAPTDL